MPQFQPEYLAVLIPIIVSVALEKGPPFLREWWKGVVDKELKPTVLFVGSIVVVLAVRGLACVGIDVGLGAQCSDPGNAQAWVNTIGLGVAAWILMELTFKFTNPVPAAPTVMQTITNEAAKSGAKPTSSEVTMTVNTAPVDKP